MRILYHFELCPFSRQVRILLAEKQVKFELKKENYWEKSELLINYNPSAELPIIKEENGDVITDIFAIIEYIESSYRTDYHFLGKSIKENAEIRRLQSWFNRKFYYEVSNAIIKEKVIKFFSKDGTPNSEIVRSAKINLTTHMQYIKLLLDRHKWLASDEISMADFAAAAHLSVIDYLGDIFWEKYPEVKEWYALIKSRPSFRWLLADRILGFMPAKHYNNLDF